MPIFELDSGALDEMSKQQQQKSKITLELPKAKSLSSASVFTRLGTKGKEKTKGIDKELTKKAVEIPSTSKTGKFYNF